MVERLKEHVNAERDRLIEDAMQTPHPLVALAQQLVESRAKVHKLNKLVVRRQEEVNELNRTIMSLQRELREARKDNK